MFQLVEDDSESMGKNVVLFTPTIPRYGTVWLLIGETMQQFKDLECCRRPANAECSPW